MRLARPVFPRSCEVGLSQDPGGGAPEAGAGEQPEPDPAPATTGYPLVKVAEVLKWPELRPESGNESFYTVEASRVPNYPAVGIYYCHHKALDLPISESGKAFGGYRRRSDSLRAALNFWTIKFASEVPAPIYLGKNRPLGVSVVGNETDSAGSH